MKRFLTAVALVCVLAPSAFAGDIPTVDFTPPPPPQSRTMATGANPVDIPTVDGSISMDLVQTAVLTIIGLMAR